MAYTGAPSLPYSKLGIVEDGDTASRAISKDAYVIWKGGNYFAKTDILQGATFVVDTNLTEIPDGALNGIIDALNASLGSYELLYSGGNTNSSTVPSLSKYKWLLFVETWQNVFALSTLIPREIFGTTIKDWYVNHIDSNGYRIARLHYIDDTTIKISEISSEGWYCILYGIK